MTLVIMNSKCYDNSSKLVVGQMRDESAGVFDWRIFQIKAKDLFAFGIW